MKGRVLMGFTQAELYTLKMLIKTEIGEVEDLITSIDDEADKAELTVHLAIINEIYKKL